MLSERMPPAADDGMRDSVLDPDVPLFDGWLMSWRLSPQRQALYTLYYYIYKPRYEHI